MLLHMFLCEDKDSSEYVRANDIYNLSEAQFESHVHHGDLTYNSLHH